VDDTAIGLLNSGLHSGLRSLPTDWCSAFGALASKLSPGRFPKSDARARRLWKSLRPEDAGDVDAAVTRIWRNAGRTMAEYSVLDRLYAEGRVQIEGVEYMEAERAANRPILLAGLHLGNWEVIAATGFALGFPGAGFFELQENRFDRRIADKARRRFGADLVAPSRVAAGRRALRILTEKKLTFLIYVDEMFQGRVSAPSFGGRRRIEGNIAHIARLARMTDADILPIYALRIGDAARFKFVVKPPIKTVRSDDRDADLAANVAAIERVIEPIVKAHLDQWFYALDFEFDAPTA
jgi:KDO2-lipid IV(A) lauroyltransferase